MQEWIELEDPQKYFVWKTVDEGGGSVWAVVGPLYSISNADINVKLVSSVIVFSTASVQFVFAISCIYQNPGRGLPCLRRGGNKWLTVGGRQMNGSHYYASAF